jgi:thioredoxin-dependent peroxiredoxin
MIEEGTEAPDFELTTDEGSTIRLSGVRGKPVGLYFYPKHDLPATIYSKRSVRGRRPLWPGR